jgi:hypothetical protein
MMVNYLDDDRLLLVLQIDHTRIAGLFAAHWGNDEFERLKPYTSMVLATQEHDTGWWEWEIRPTLNKEGYPLDYIGSVGALGQEWLDFYEGIVGRIAPKDAYAAYFVSMHGDGLVTKGMGLLDYMPDWSSVDPRFKAFVDQQHEIRSELLKEMRSREELAEVTSDEYLWKNYRHMEVFDQLGQFVCNRYPFNSTAREKGPSKTLSDLPVPVGPGKQDVNIMVDVRDETTAVMTPYPFDIDPLPVSFQGRILPNRPYESQEEFLDDFYRAERLNVNYVLRSS